jgi:peptide/nickel transport system ATP-binding protein
MKAVEFSDFSVAYENGVRAVDGVSVAVEEGTCLAIVGQSGSGKTTIARALLDLLPPSARIGGRMRVAGNDLMRLSPDARRKQRGRMIGYVPQDPFGACDPLRSVRHHIEEAWHAVGVSAPAGTVETRLQMLGIEDARRRARLRPHQWSGGMLQRAVIVAATAHNPILTVADEPTSALDANTAHAVLADLRGRCRALLLISHDLDLVLDHADEVAIMAQGAIVEHGSVAQITGRPAHAVTREMLEVLDRRYGGLAS